LWGKRGYTMKKKTKKNGRIGARNEKKRGGGWVFFGGGVGFRRGLERVQSQQVDWGGTEPLAALPASRIMWCMMGFPEKASLRGKGKVTAAVRGSAVMAHGRVHS